MANLIDRYPRLNDELIKYPKSELLVKKRLSYGTSGFRDKAELLASTFHRLGIFAILRSRHQGKIIGLMVTASHNEASDNGIKLIDPKGDMLSQEWEVYATELANADTENDVISVLTDIITKEKIDMDKTGNIFIARDTRESSERLAELAREGALLVGGNVLDFGLQTTPQLHHLVRMWNYDNYNNGDWASEAGYYNMLIDGYKQCLNNIHNPSDITNNLIVDGAHGIGALQMAKISKEINLTSINNNDKTNVNIIIYNFPNDGELNYLCGAEYCQKQQKPPKLAPKDNNNNAEIAQGTKMCSFDGDADRIVYHYVDNNSKWVLLDGDKIACLFAMFFSNLIKEIDNNEGLFNDISFGVVQTAYANGSSTNYLNNEKISNMIAKTGVKYCHEVASKNYNIGIYFESNGHGTALINDDVVEKINSLESNSNNTLQQKEAINLFLGAYQLMNQAAGDAMSICLLVEIILFKHKMSISDWSNLYTDYYTRQSKIVVENRNIIKCNVNETRVIEPKALQDAIDDILKEINLSNDNKGHIRAFIRPSGTENIVRIYAESENSQTEADSLALLVMKCVHKYAKGAGPEPETIC